jgi:hypothetical protein
VLAVTAAATAVVVAVVVVVVMMVVVVVVVMIVIMAVVMIMVMIVMHSKISFAFNIVFLNYKRRMPQCQNIYFSDRIPHPGLRIPEKMAIIREIIPRKKERTGQWITTATNTIMNTTMNISTPTVSLTAMAMSTKIRRPSSTALPGPWAIWKR